MIAVNKEQFKEFIFAQDDNARIDMIESNSNYGCGCIMVQFGKQKLNLTDFICGYSDFTNFDSGTGKPTEISARLEDELDNFIIKASVRRITNYKQAKTLWNEYFEE